MIQPVFLDHLINIASNLLMLSHWDERGIGWARENPVPDIDDTVMGLRILGLHGYNASSGILRCATVFTPVCMCQVCRLFQVIEFLNVQH